MYFVGQLTGLRHRMQSQILSNTLTLLILWKKVMFSHFMCTSMDISLSKSLIEEK